MTRIEAIHAIQRVARGYISRKRAARAREAELMFIGMKPRPQEESEALRDAMSVTATKRKTEQVENREAYEDALEELHRSVMEEEGPEVRSILPALLRNPRNV